MSASTEGSAPEPVEELPRLVEIEIARVEANERNPRLEFPQSELDKLSESIALEGVLVPIVVYPKGDKYVLIDGERRFRCSRELGLQKIPAVVTEERTPRELLQQMFNIHLIREPWRDMPTAKALKTLSEQYKESEGTEPSDAELRDLTGMSLERVRQLRYAADLPGEWQEHIESGEIPLNFFWELKKVVDSIKKNRPKLAEEIGAERIRESFVEKRLAGTVSDTVSLRDVSPIAKFAAKIASESGNDETDLDDTLRTLITDPNATIADAYEDTVQLMVAVDKLERRANSMVAVFTRLAAETAGTDDHDLVIRVGRKLIADLEEVVGKDEPTA